MSTKEIVNYEELLASMAKAASNVEKPSGLSIGTKAGVLTYGGAPVAGNKLDVIVVASVHANTYYDAKYDANNLSSPVCYAYSEDGNNMAPHPTSSKPQAATCDECPLNKWGSDPEGGRGKACKNGRSLAVIPADTKADGVLTAEIAILKPPVTSIKNWQMYVQKAAALYNRPPLALVTQVGTVPDQKTQYKVTFTDIKPVDNSLLGPLIERVPAALEMCQKVYEASEAQADTAEKKPAKY